MDTQPPATGLAGTPYPKKAGVNQLRHQVRMRSNARVTIALYKRSNNPGAPWYHHLKFQGKSIQYCTDTDDENEAAARVITYKKRLALGLGPDVPIASPSDPSCQEIITAYRAIPLPIKEATRESNIKRFEYLIKRMGLSVTDPVSTLTRKKLKELEIRERNDNRLSSYCSTVRQARSLFSHRAIDEYEERGIQIPDMRGFLLTPLPYVPKRGFQPPPSDWVDMIYGVCPIDQRLHNVHLLSCYAGLRAKEASHSHVSWVQSFAGRYVVVVPGEFSKNGRERRVSIAKEVAESLLANADTDGCLVSSKINDPRYRAPVTDAGVITRRRYALIVGDYAAWLTELGLASQKKSHEIRKIFGSRVAIERGLTVAQNQLGHATPQITSDHYVNLLKAPEPIATTWANKEAPEDTKPTEANNAAADDGKSLTA